MPSGDGIINCPSRVHVITGGGLPVILQNNVIDESIGLIETFSCASTLTFGSTKTILNNK